MYSDTQKCNGFHLGPSSSRHVLSRADEFIMRRSLLRVGGTTARSARRGRARSFSAAATEEREKLVIFDTTLRDGEQSPGATLTADEKVDIGKQLARLGVDVCEAGFPIASAGDFEAVQRVAHAAGHLLEGRASGQTMRIAGLARANKKDIERCYEAVHSAPLHRVHTFLASSDIHLEHKLNITRKECLETAAAMVAFTRALSSDSGFDIEFSPEDAGRSDPDFLVELCSAVIEAGATTINLPDTVGYTMPQEYGSLFAYLIANTETGGKDIIWSTHCHNDLGLATANSLAAVQQGARQIEVTLNGIGERAGNTSLEETVMALMTRSMHFPVYVDIDTKQIMSSSKMVSSYTGIAVQPNKAIVGANAFAHESGIHQHGVLKHSQTYEIISPGSIGIDNEGDRGTMVLGKLSGKAAFKQRLLELGFEDVANSSERLEKLVSEAKAVADKKKVITDMDLQALLGDSGLAGLQDHWELSDSTYMSSAKLREEQEGGGTLVSTATVALREASSGKEVTLAATGVGPVDATFRAMLSIVGRPVSLTHYVVTKIEGGSGPEHAGNDALASVVVSIEKGGAALPESGSTLPLDFPGSTGVTVYETEDGVRRSVKAVQYSGTGTSTDIVVASARAYLGAINRLIAAEQAQ